MSNNGDDYEDDFDPVEGEALDNEPSGEDVGDEEWDSYDEQQDDENLGDEDQDIGEDAPPKKKSGLFNIVLIAVAVIAVGGFIFMQMGKNAPPAAPPAPIASNTAPTQAPETESAGMLGSPQELAKLQEEMAKHSVAQQQPEPTPVAPVPQPVTEPIAQASTPAPAAVAPSPVQPPTEVVDAKTPPMPTAMEAAPLPSPVVSEKPAIAVLDAPPVVVKTDDGITHMPKAQDIMLRSPAAPEVTPAPAPTPSGNADAAALNIRIDTLLTRIASLETEVNSLKDKNDQADQIDSLKSSVDTLEKKIDSLPSGGAAKASKKAAPAPETAPVDEDKKPAPQILGETDNSPLASPAAETVKRAVVTKAVRVSTSWILKGAQPGQAMVAKAGESDIRTVRIGDTLPGIGKITAIEYQAGRWSVMGTQGRINQ